MADGTVRLDKWLWAARIYKTRAVASQAISTGKVLVNGSKAKRARPLAVGDRLRVRKGPFEFHLEVRALSERRGPARVAASLYVEDAASRAARDRLARQLKIAPPPAYDGKGRPTKRDRRELDRLQGDLEN